MGPVQDMNVHSRYSDSRSFCSISSYLLYERYEHSGSRHTCSVSGVVVHSQLHTNAGSMRAFTASQPDPHHQHQHSPDWVVGDGVQLVVSCLQAAQQVGHALDVGVVGHL